MRTLKVKCPTWQHVETFYERKLRRDRTLTIRVPFHPEQGSIITLGLQLPSGEVMAIDGVVVGVDSNTGGKAAVRLRLDGMTDEILDQLRRLVAGHREHDRPVAQGRSNGPATNQRVGSAPPVRVPPAAVPEDAPMSELVEPPQEPERDKLGSDERYVLEELERELGRLLECAAHEVLGIGVDAEVDVIRSAYFELTKRFHPDLFARYRSPAVVQVAQEVFIYINRAYDRIRDSAVQAGRAVVAGPALLLHDGWLAGLDDVEPAAAQGSVPAYAPVTGSRPMILVQGTVEQLMAAGDFEGAREHVAEALHAQPRDRQLRALYHVVSGRQALAEGDPVLAASQYDAALAHDRDCRDARAGLDELHASGRPGAGGVRPRAMR